MTLSIVDYMKSADIICKLAGYLIFNEVLSPHSNIITRIYRQSFHLTWFVFRLGGSFGREAPMNCLELIHFRQKTLLKANL